MSVTHVCGSPHLCEGPWRSIIDHAKIAIFRKMRVELEVFQVTKNRLPSYLFRFSDRLVSY